MSQYKESVTTSEPERPIIVQGHARYEIKLLDAQIEFWDSLTESQGDHVAIRGAFEKLERATGLWLLFNGKAIDSWLPTFLMLSEYATEASSTAASYEADEVAEQWQKVAEIYSKPIRLIHDAYPQKSESSQEDFQLAKDEFKRVIEAEIYERGLAEEAFERLKNLVRGSDESQLLDRVFEVACCAISACIDSKGSEEDRDRWRSIASELIVPFGEANSLYEQMYTRTLISENGY